MQDDVAELLTDVLVGKAVRRIEFVGENEVRVEFNDGSRLSFTSTIGALDSSYAGPGVKAPGT